MPAGRSQLCSTHVPMTPQLHQQRHRIQSSSCCKVLLAPLHTAVALTLKAVEFVDCLNQLVTGCIAASAHLDPRCTCAFEYACITT